MQVIYFSFKLHEKDIESRNTYEKLIRGLKNWNSQIIKKIEQIETQRSNELAVQVKSFLEDHSIKRIRKLTNQIKHQANIRFEKNNAKKILAFKFLMEDGSEGFSSEYTDDILIDLKVFDDVLLDALTKLGDFYNFLTDFMGVEWSYEVMTKGSFEEREDFLKTYVAEFFFSQSLYYDNKI